MADSSYISSKETTTGTWYASGRINVSVDLVKLVPWEKITKIVVIYDPVEDEVKIKRLVYKT